MGRQVTMQFGGSTAVNRAGGDSPVPTSSKWKLLWTNTSPSSNFAAQTVPLDLSGYDAVYITFASTSGSQYASQVILVGSPLFYVRINSNSGSNLRFFSRQTTVSTSGVEFGTCGRYQQGTSGSTTDNSNLIPNYIYGIKFG